MMNRGESFRRIIIIIDEMNKTQGAKNRPANVSNYIFKLF